MIGSILPILIGLHIKSESCFLDLALLIILILRHQDPEERGPPAATEGGTSPPAPKDSSESSGVSTMAPEGSNGHPISLKSSSGSVGGAAFYMECTGGRGRDLR